MQVPKPERWFLVLLPEPWLQGLWEEAGRQPRSAACLEDLSDMNKAKGAARSSKDPWCGFFSPLTSTTKPEGMCGE